jgi:hypothetical protein
VRATFRSQTRRIAKNVQQGEWCDEGREQQRRGGGWRGSMGAYKEDGFRPKGTQTRFGLSALVLDSDGRCVLSRGNQLFRRIER